MTPDKFTLLIIDCQNDFTREDGNLYVPSCDHAISTICNFIKDNTAKIDRVILAKSNHPTNYCIFAHNGGSHPKYCVENTAGSKIDSRILDVIKKNNLKWFELNHGEVAEFEENSVSMYSRYIDNGFVLATATDARRVNTEDIVVCGVTGDVAVTSTINDLVKQFPEEHIHVLIGGVANVNQDIIMNTIETYHNINII